MENSVIQECKYCKVQMVQVGSFQNGLYYVCRECDRVVVK